MVNIKYLLTTAAQNIHLSLKEGKDKKVV